MADCRIARRQSRCADAGAWILAHRRAGFSRYTGWRRSDKQDRSGFQSEASRRGRIADPSGLAKYRARRRWRSDGPPGLARQGALVQILGFEWLAHAGSPEWTHSAARSRPEPATGTFFGAKLGAFFDFERARRIRSWPGFLPDSCDRNDSPRHSAKRSF